jgi:hypothetical protein
MRPAIAAAAFLLACLLARSALAFHAGDMFGKPAGAGGGGGVFYTGVPAERGWSCSACHVDAAGLVSITLQADAQQDLADGQYAPKRAYRMTATLTGEHEGLPRAGFNSAANFNSLAVSIIDQAGKPAGSISGYAAEDFYANGAATIVSAGQQVGATSWQFTWTAPGAGAGPVSIHIAAVDGNGANSPPSVTLTDPWGDDVFVGTLVLAEGGSAGTADMPPSFLRRAACSGTGRLLGQHERRDLRSGRGIGSGPSGMQQRLGELGGSLPARYLHRSPSRRHRRRRRSHGRPGRRAAASARCVRAGLVLRSVEDHRRQELHAHVHRRE